MSTSVALSSLTGLSRIKLFFALSRTPHGLLDLCTPLLVAILWLGRLPDPAVGGLGLLAAFAGYTAVYALNDIVDYRVDREKVRQSGFCREGNYLDAAMVRHPLAQGLLSLPEAIGWAGCWALISLFAAYRLNPVCAFILVAGCVLEAVYCLLLKVSQMRVLVSGVVKTLGGLAAVFAVEPNPDAGLLLLLFSWLFFWEVGGQNVPADWHDIEEDAALAAKTVPVIYGSRGASRISLVALVISAVLGAVFLHRVPMRFPLPLYFVGVVTGLLLLVLPGWRLYRERSREAADALFNRASYYPLSLLAVAAAALLLANR